MSKRTPRLLLEDIQESAEKILKYTRNLSFEEFSEDNKTVDAVIRNFEIIGEAFKRILDKDAGIEISYAKKITSLRNRIIHGYDVISDELIWGILINDMTNLKSEISSLLK